MKNFIKIGFLALALAFSGTLAAQDFEKPNSNFLTYYNAELFQWSYGLFGGLTLTFQNENSLTSYGVLKEPMKEVLFQHGDVSKKYRSYRGKTIAGQALMWTGLAAVLAGVYVPALGSWKSGSVGNGLQIGLGVSLGGLVSGVVGMILFNAGQEDIFDAVNLYNRHKLNDFKG
jgi:hypothetical protein